MAPGYDSGGDDKDRCENSYNWRRETHGQSVTCMTFLLASKTFLLN